MTPQTIVPASWLKPTPKLPPQRQRWTKRCGNNKSLRNLQPMYPYINFAAESIAAWLDGLA